MGAGGEKLGGLELLERSTYDSLDVPLFPFPTTETVASLKDQGFSAARAVPASSSDGRRWRNLILGFVEMQLGVVGSLEVCRVSRDGGQVVNTFRMGKRAGAAAYPC